MLTIQFSIDEFLLAEIDRVTQSLAMTRDEFVRQALETALRRSKIRILEQRDREGYARHPVAPDEFDEWESVRVWGEM
ncbi:MAG: CopG family transcriptional regulator [Blastocatellia bacterium]